MGPPTQLHFDPMCYRKTTSNTHKNAPTNGPEMPSLSVLALAVKPCHQIDPKMSECWQQERFRVLVYTVFLNHVSDW